MILINKSVAYFIGGILMLYICSCERKRNTVVDELSRIVGQQVCLPDDSVFYDSSAKILILMRDTGDCSPCSMELNEWAIYYMDMENRGLDGEVIYVLPENTLLPAAVDSTLFELGLKSCYGYESFVKRNPYLENVSYSTFLISPECKVELVGSPLESPELWVLYRKALGEEQ